MSTIHLQHTPSKRLRFDYRCPSCDSLNVAVDAAVRWDFELQRFFIASIHDVVTCQDCGRENDASRCHVKVEG